MGCLCCTFETKAKQVDHHEAQIISDGFEDNKRRYTVKISVRNSNINKIIKTEWDRTLDIDEFRKGVRYLFEDNTLTHILFQGNPLNSGTLEENGIEDNCMVDVVDNKNRFLK
jgi:hypothetical protein